MLARGRESERKRERKGEGEREKVREREREADEDLNSPMQVRVIFNLFLIPIVRGFNSE